MATGTGLRQWPNGHKKSPAVGPGLSVRMREDVRDQESTQLTMPLKAVTSTMMPNTMRYQAKGTKLLEAM